MCAQASRDIIRVGDVWATDLSPLEMQNAETKRVASSSGSRRLEISEKGLMLIPMRDGKFGPERLISTRGNCTTMAVSTLKHLMLTQKLRRGDPHRRRTRSHARRAHTEYKFRASVRDEKTQIVRRLRELARLRSGRDREKGCSRSDGPKQAQKKV